MEIKLYFLVMSRITLPSPEANRLLCIFMASTTQTSWPAPI